MNQISDYFLVLFPTNPTWAPESLANLIDALKAVGLLGAEREPYLFGTGLEFLSLVTYLGCSPHITLGESENATTIRLCGAFLASKFLHGNNLKPPRCPQCRKTLEKAAESPSVEEKLRCSHCGWSAQAPLFDWQRSAAFGRVFIEISNVFESEAVPGENLTDCLQQATGEIWDYSYVRKASN